MSDDSATEKVAIQSVWPESKQLLCHFHVAQAQWRWLFCHSSEIPKQERPCLMKLFQAVMYATSEEKLLEALNVIVNEKDAYPNYVRRLMAFYERKVEWVLLYRMNLLTRQNNTNNYAEATVRILKDVVLCRTKAFNIVALVEFCLSVWENYLVRKLLDYAYSRKTEVNILYSKLSKKVQNYTVHDIKLLEWNLFEVKSASKEISYVVNSEICCCSCPSGISGAFCKHQFFLMQEKKIKFPNAPPATVQEKHNLAVLALGDKCPPAPFFSSFQKSGETDAANVPSQLLIVSNLLMNTADVITADEQQSSSSSQNCPSIASAEIKIQILKEFQRVGNLLGDVTEEMAKRLLKTLKNVQSGNDFSKFYFLRSKCTRKINVQPTSISRRRPGLKKVPSGRPPVRKPTRGLKRKRNV